MTVKPCGRLLFFIWIISITVIVAIYLLSDFIPEKYIIISVIIKYGLYAFILAVSYILTVISGFTRYEISSSHIIIYSGFIYKKKTFFRITPSSTVTVVTLPFIGAFSLVSNPSGRIIVLNEIKI